MQSPTTPTTIEQAILNRDVPAFCALTLAAPDLLRANGGSLLKTAAVTRNVFMVNFSIGLFYADPQPGDKDLVVRVREVAVKGPGHLPNTPEIIEIFDNYLDQTIAPDRSPMPARGADPAGQSVGS